VSGLLQRLLHSASSGNWRQNLHSLVTEMLRVYNVCEMNEDRQ
jgi:hypothetical protein